jgi:hypothetical protein
MLTLFLVLAAAACTGSGGSDPSTSSPDDTRENLGGLTFVVYESDDGARLRIRPGDEVVARLGLSSQSAPPWRVTATPNPRILTTGERQRVLPPDSVTGEPYDEIEFQAIGTGTTRIVFGQGSSSQDVTIRLFVNPG